jgi:NAD(P)-dependent dehydrogenase (short-subunit alcohol dehydrogenase family)
MNQPVVLITGALTGIGRATAIAFAREGNRVVISGRREEAGQTQLRALGAEAEFLRADVRFEAEVRSVVEQTVKRFGRIDVAVNNAGTEGQLAPIVEQSAANSEDTFAVNVPGTLLSVKHEMRAMLAQGSGSIINLSSIAGQVGIAGASVYAASKHAVEGITKSAALERRRRRACQRRGSRPCGYRDARSLRRRQRSGQGGLPFDDTGATRRHAGRDRPIHRVPR